MNSLIQNDLESIYFWYYLLVLQIKYIFVWLDLIYWYVDFNPNFLV